MRWHLLILSSVLALAAIKAQEIDRDDYPPACQNECFSLVNTTESCDDSTDGDTNYLSCVCGSTDASSRLVACGTCIRSNGGDSDNEAIELALKCGFAIPASSSSGGGPSSTTPAASTASLSTTTLANGVMSTSAQSNAPAATTSNSAAPTAGSSNAADRLGAPMAAVLMVLAPILAVL